MRLLGAVLAGGRSRRMGADKARLGVRGEPLLERTVRLVAEVGLPVVVVGRPRPPDWAGDPALAFLPDERPGAGPLGGLVAALRAATRAEPPAEAVLLLPCDLPLLTAGALGFLVAEARARRPGHGLVLRRGEELEPLPAVFGAACLPAAERRLQAGQLSLRGLVAEVPMERVAAPAWLLASLRNANTPGDLAELLAPVAWCYTAPVNTADLHPKRFSFSLTVSQLRQLSEELLAMEQQPHPAAASPDKRLERDRAGEQLATHLGMLVADTRDREPGAVVTDSVPLLRSGAKYLLTACDRCRRLALRTALHALEAGHPDAQAAAATQVRAWDNLMRQLAEQHGVSTPYRELVEPVAASPQDLARLGLSRDALVAGEELLARF